MGQGAVIDQASRREERLVRGAYGVSLVFVLLSVVVSIALGDQQYGQVSVGLLQAGALLVTLRVSDARRRVVVGAMIAAGAASVLAAALTYADVEGAQPLVAALWALIVVSAIGSIIKRVANYGEVNLQTVLGLLTLYLLIGVLFGYIFALLGAYQPFFSSGESDPASYVYFSFVTLSTTGYGDLTPAIGLPRALAVGEAMTGQLYLVSVVSMAVGRIAGSDRVRRKEA